MTLLGNFYSLPETVIAYANLVRHYLSQWITLA